MAASRWTMFGASRFTRLRVCAKSRNCGKSREGNQFRKIRTLGRDKGGSGPTASRSGNRANHRHRNQKQQSTHQGINNHGTLQHIRCYRSAPGIPNKCLLFSISCVERYVQIRRQKWTTVGGSYRRSSTKTSESVRAGLRRADGSCQLLLSRMDPSPV